MSADRVPAVLVRVVVVVGAVLVVLGAARAETLPVAALAIGVALGLLRPVEIGAWAAVPAAAWTLAAGGSPTLGGALLATAGGYLVHTGLAASSAVPWSARVSGAVLRRWTLRCAPAVVLTLVVAGVDAVVGPTPRSALLLVGAVGAVLLAAGSLPRLLAAVDTVGTGGTGNPDPAGPD